MSQPVASALVFLYHAANAIRLATRGRHLVGIAGAMIVGTPYAVGWLLMLQIRRPRAVAGICSRRGPGRSSRRGRVRGARGRPLRPQRTGPPDPSASRRSGGRSDRPGHLGLCRCRPRSGHEDRRVAGGDQEGRSIPCRSWIGCSPPWPASRGMAASVGSRRASSGCSSWRRRPCPRAASGPGIPAHRPDPRRDPRRRRRRQGRSARIGPRHEEGDRLQRDVHGGPGLVGLL